MRKLVISASILALSGSVYATTLAQTDNFKRWSFTTEFVTLNPEVPKHISDLEVGPKVALQYNFNPNWYVSGSALRGKHDKWTVGATLGVQASRGYVQPYLEGNINMIPRAGKPATKTFGYDVGSQFVFTKYVVPFVEFDNFFKKDKEVAQVGVTVPLPHSLSVGAAYAWQVQGNGNGANVKLSYAF